MNWHSNDQSFHTRLFATRIEARHQFKDVRRVEIQPAVKLSKWRHDQIDYVYGST
jgi:hypothetical protein